MRNFVLTAAFVLASCTTAFAYSGDAVLHGSSTSNGSQYPNCGFFYTAVPGTVSSDPVNGSGSDDGMKYSLDISTVGGASDFSRVTMSDATQLGIIYQLSPCPATTCAGGGVPICKVRLK